jgi:hypothetical protein
LCLVAAAGLCRPGLGAQPPGGVPQPTENFEAEGVIDQIIPGRIQMTTNANQKWLIWITPQTRVVLTGTATADLLRPGMCVRLHAAIDKQGNVTDKVEQLTVFTPERRTTFGLWSEAGKEQFGTGGQSKVYEIVGRIAGAQQGKLAVAAGSAALKLELSEQAKIDDNLNDLSLARPGDKITVRGRMFPGQPGMGQAAEVQVSAAAVLGAAKPKPTKAEPKTKKTPPATKEPKEE